MADPIPLTSVEVALIDRAARPAAGAGRVLMGLGIAMLLGTAGLAVALGSQLDATFETPAETKAYAYGLLIGRLTAGAAAAGLAFGAVTLFAGWLLLRGPIAERDRLIRKLAADAAVGDAAGARPRNTSHRPAPPR